MSEVSKSLQYSANDWFYMKRENGEVCDTNSYNGALCDANKCAVSSLQVSTDNLGAAEMLYNDAKMLYNRELLFSVNMFAGLVLICYYVYVNQSALPSPAGALKNMGTASSWTSRLAMSPAIT